MYTVTEKLKLNQTNQNLKSNYFFCKPIGFINQNTESKSVPNQINQNLLNLIFLLYTCFI